MRHTTVLLAIAVAATLATPATADESIGFKVVIHPDNPTESLYRVDVANLFTDKVARWDFGLTVVAVDQLADSETRKRFSNAVLHKSPSAIQRFWQRQIFVGNAVPPAELASDAAVLKFVSLEPRAIGYVSANVPIPDTVRVLEVEDLDNYDATPFPGDAVPAALDQSKDGSSLDDEDRYAKDETLSLHGVVHLFLTGSCGPEGEGRQAVVENLGGGYALDVEIETSIWDDKWLRSSSVSRHTVQPLGEKRLGCTRRPGDVEWRYAIVRASNVAPHVVKRQHNRPARSMVRIVDSGSCGQQHSGHWRSVINRHPSRAIAVSVEFREDFEGKLRRRYLKEHRLQPGATKRLGCSADGPTTRRFTVLEAKYR